MVLINTISLGSQPIRIGACVCVCVVTSCLRSLCLPHFHLGYHLQGMLDKSTKVPVKSAAIKKTGIVVFWLGCPFRRQT